MKLTLLTILVFASAATASPRALREHVDMHWSYDEVEGWTCEAKTVGNGFDIFDELDEVYLPIDDAPFGSNGQRNLQVPDPEYAFTGVAPDDPIWIAPQIQQSNQCWPGFNNYQSLGVFGSYLETDERLSEADRDNAQPWIKITLQGVTYQGAGSGAFSLWQDVPGSPPILWFSTVDNTHPDTYLFEAGGHKHMNWGFASPGIYRIRLSASAYRGPGQTNPTGSSDVFTVTFAVGVFAQWQAENFSPTQLDNAAICGPTADPDNDGFNNHLEYAFGTNPLSGSAVPVSPGLGMPKHSLVTEGSTVYQTLTYPRRKEAQRLFPDIYQPLFANSLSHSWSDAGVTTTTASFPPAQANLNSQWELATSRIPLPPGQSKGFARVKVSLGDGFTPNP